ncbi:hypothetical protein ADUPG1_005556, partial [Aduncisulcus paluster]
RKYADVCSKLSDMEGRLSDVHQEEIKQTDIDQPKEEGKPTLDSKTIKYEMMPKHNYEEKSEVDVKEESDSFTSSESADVKTLSLENQNLSTQCGLQAHELESLRSENTRLV